VPDDAYPPENPESKIPNLKYQISNLKSSNPGLASQTEKPVAFNNHLCRTPGVGTSGVGNGQASRMIHLLLTTLQINLEPHHSLVKEPSFQG
jgi:hypothetical protein